jgi:hypothetical protein
VSCPLCCGSKFYVYLIEIQKLEKSPVFCSVAQKQKDFDNKEKSGKHIGILEQQIDN